jgi:hypothetical protein
MMKEARSKNFLEYDRISKNEPFVSIVFLKCFFLL